MNTNLFEVAGNPEGVTAKNAKRTKKRANGAQALHALRGALKPVLGRLLVVGALALAVCAARANEEQDLIAVLKSGTNALQKCDACVKLRVVGTDKAVPALAALLSDERTGHAARYALEGMPSKAAEAALRKALGHTSGALQAGLIDSVGWRRDAAAVPSLQKALFGTDTTNAAAAACALGRIGGKKAIAALSTAQQKVAPELQPAVEDGLLRCAEQLLASRDAKGAATIYRSLLAPQVANHLRAAAWRGLVLADASGRTALVSQALTGQDKPLHTAALQVLRELKDAPLVEACVGQWQTLPADAQLAVLDARLKLGGDTATIVRTASQSPQAAVRVAAWQALGDLGDGSAVPALTKAAAQGEPAEREAARESLARLHGPGVAQAISSQLSQADAAEKVVLVRALGERSDRSAAKVLLESAGNEQPEAVRLAALESLRQIAEPSTAAPLLTLAANAKSEAAADPILTALYAVCQDSPDKSATSQAVLQEFKGLPEDAARQVMPVLAELATPEALAAAQTAAQGKPDSETTKVAVRVLAQWPTAAPATPLLELARTTPDPVLQVLALRGCINLAGEETDNAKRLALLQQALAVAKRPEEKKQALSQLGQVPTTEALQAAMGYLGEADLANEAGLAAMTIAEKLAPAQPALARETATKVLAQCNTPDIVKRAWAIRGRAVGQGPFIQDWMVSGPYKKAGITGAEALFDVAFGPEQSGTAVDWKPLPRGKTADLASFFPQQQNCVAYLKTKIVVPKDCDAALLLGSDDGVKAWLNGAVVHSNNVDRGMVVDQDMAPIQLKKGANELLLKVTQGGGGWGACARVVGRDGRPIRGLKYQVER